MQVNIDTRGLQATIDQLRGFPRRARFAALVGMTRTAQLAAVAERAEISDVFDRPTQRTKEAIYVRAATPARPQAEVGVKDNIFSSGRAPITWLRWNIYGGLRTKKAYERLLVGAGAMRDGDVSVPGRFARLDAYGNMSRGQITQILSQLRSDSSSGSSRSLPRLKITDTAKDARYKKGVIRRAYARAGGQYIALPNGRGRLRPGIYQTRTTGFGRTDPRPVLIFVDAASYEAGRFDFEFVARLAIERHLSAEVTRAVAAELAEIRVA